MKKIFTKCLSMILSLVVVFTVMVSGTVVSLARQENAFITPELKEKLEQCSNDESIKVYVWYEDIDYKGIEHELSAISEIEVEDLAMPDNSLLNELATIDESGAYNEEIQKNMQTYLERTAGCRDEERARTNRYIKEERRLASSMYEEKSKELINKLGISAESIIFTSKYSPMMILELSKSQILKVQKEPTIKKINCYKEDKIVVASASTVKAASRITNAQSATGLTGTGMAIGIIECGRPDSSATACYTFLQNETNISSFPISEHPSMVLDIIGSSNGILPNADLYVTAAVNVINIYSNIEYMLSYNMDNPITIINASWGIGTREEYVDWFDHIVSHHKITICAASGNEPEKEVLCPACCANVIAVGAINDNGTGGFGDDTYEECNRFINNSVNGIEKPDVLASDKFYSNSSGTSLASPVVTGIAAMLIQLKPSLANSPQTVKAIIMASCHRKVSEDMGLISAKEGAGVVDAYRAVCIVGRNQYCSFTVNNNRKIAVQKPLYGSSNISFALAWPRDVVPNVTHGWSGCSSPSYANLNMSITYVENGVSLTKSSSLASSSAECRYFATSCRKGEYKVTVTNNTSSISNVRAALAWGTDDEVYRNTAMDGLYYISSEDNSFYLNPSSTCTVYNSLGASNWSNMLWVIQNYSGNTYTFKSNASSYNGQYLVNGSQVEAGIYYAKNANSGIVNILVVPKTDGAYTLKKKVTSSSGQYYLKTHTIAATNYPVWYATATDGLDQCWTLPRAGYFLGDMNMDGIINSTDASILSQYVAGEVSVNAAEVFLADIDGDGSATTQDLLYLNRHIAGYSGYPL